MSRLFYKIKTEKKTSEDVRFIPGQKTISPKEAAARVEAIKPPSIAKLFRIGSKNRVTSIDPTNADTKEDHRSTIQYREQFINLLTLHLNSLPISLSLSFLNSLSLSLLIVTEGADRLCDLQQKKTQKCVSM